jgi:SAM-dependent methyltransferase
MKRSRKPVYAFGKIRDKVKYRLKFAHFPYLAKAVLREGAASPQGLCILDVGCGPGNVAEFCRLAPGSKWFGVDLWEHQLRQAAEKGVYEGLFQVNLLEGLPFREDSFDVVICSEVLMYLPNAPALLADFHRVLRAGGMLFIYNPISWMPRTLSRLKSCFRRIHQEKESVALDDGRSSWRRARRPSRVNYYSFRGLVEQIEDANFQTTDIMGFRIFRNRIRIMTRLENFRWYFLISRYLTRRFPYLAADLMVVSRKRESAYYIESAISRRAAA